MTPTEAMGPVLRAVRAHDEYRDEGWAPDTPEAWRMWQLIEQSIRDLVIAELEAMRCEWACEDIGPTRPKCRRCLRLAEWRAM